MFEPEEPKKTRTLRNQRVRHPRPNQVTVRGIGAVVSSVHSRYVTGPQIRLTLLGELRHLYIVAVEQVAGGVFHGGDSEPITDLRLHQA